MQFAYPQLGEIELREAYRTLYYPDDASYRPLLDETPPQIIRQFFHAAASRFGPLTGKRVLDYGCGPGTLGRIARERDMPATGIEFDPNARERVREAATCDVYENLAALLAEEINAQFDWIVVWNVIEHLREPWVELGRLAPLLRPDGRLILTTPNADCLKGRMLGARWDQRTNPTHFYYFSAKSLTALLRRAGFEEIEEWTLFTSYPHHGVLRRILQRILVTRGLQGGLVFVASVVNGIPSSGRGKFASRPAEIHLETSGALR